MIEDNLSADRERCALNPVQTHRPGIGDEPPAGTDGLPSMDYRSVGRHNTEKSAYVVYDGLVYDITDFLHQVRPYLPKP